MRVITLSLLFALSLAAQDVTTGRAAFENRCGKCHGGDGNGGELGPAITGRLPARTDAGRLHILRRAGDKFRAVTSETNWPSYNGQLGGNRYTTLSQINKSTVTKLGP